MRSNLFKTKKGQGLSLSVIIIAALALIVLVVLIMVFTGRIGLFQDKINEKGDETLIEARIQYGTCHPSAVSEVKFKAGLTAAEGTEEQAIAKAEFQDHIGDCNRFSSGEDECEAEDGCSWE